jgi:hypothetical protein
MTDYDDDRKRSGSKYNPHVPGGCPVCGIPHIAADGGSIGFPSCHGHRKNPETGARDLPCRRRPQGNEDGKQCRFHSGKTKAALGATARRKEARLTWERENAAMLAIREEMRVLGVAIDGNPSEFMYEQVREAGGNVAYLRKLVQQLTSDVDDQGDHGVIIDEEGVARIEPSWIGAGIATRVEPGNWKAAPHVIVGMYNDERDRLMRYCKMARDAGVEEARLQWEIRQGEWLVRTMDGVLDKLELTDDQLGALPGIMGQVIGELEAEARQPAVIDVAPRPDTD